MCPPHTFRNSRHRRGPSHTGARRTQACKQDRCRRIRRQDDHTGAVPSAGTSSCASGKHLGRWVALRTPPQSGNVCPGCNRPGRGRKRWGIDHRSRHSDPPPWRANNWACKCLVCHKASPTLRTWPGRPKDRSGQHRRRLPRRRGQRAAPGLVCTLLPQGSLRSGRKGRRAWRPCKLGRTCCSPVKWPPPVGPKAGWRKRDACSDFVIIKNTS
jgi:hypothetical protein